MHYKRDLYVIEEAADGTVTIRANGTLLPARRFPKDHAQLDQGRVVELEHLDGAFAWIAAQQQERDAACLASRTLTQREKQRVKKGAPVRTAPPPPP